MTPLLVALGAAVGAPLRYLVDRAIQGRHDSLFPWGTFAVNVVGSFLLGLLAAAALHTSAPIMALLGTGLCGALTTYSTFGYETVRLLRGRARLLAVLNVVASIVAGLGAAAAGVALVRLLTG
ncbi:fluoride efflux transporter CrcB [Planosporangium flavigriseum]|uniref:Fluoride-specific ion channel FluC n=1 Tax=Planosporangium flavigriseum TaxID=373681 RepID=A0A8J3LPP5_9ACTN|nr:fluoride efflux transporter CrcB [Planosporangium flavigriseum]NJC67258.1 fluoride efflux transporter CrcB [Planosporangium flavigriseum]GIG75224.1 putative fluoride ion transporter CrcB 2 [Planosporangium flavigriseum]